MQITAITGKVKRGELALNSELSLFDEGIEVIILSRADWDIIAGSDSARHQLAQAKQLLDAVEKEPEKVAEILDAARKEPKKGVLEVRK